MRAHAGALKLYFNWNGPLSLCSLRVSVYHTTSTKGFRPCYAPIFGTRVEHEGSNSDQG